MIISTIQISIGLVLLYLGAEGLVRGSSSLAKRLQISPLVIGLTIVAFGTSMPELIVSIKTALSGQGAISIGNVVGSNIFNIAIILGLSAIIYPLKTEIKLLRVDTPIMISVSILFYFFFMDKQISRIEGIIFFSMIILYTYFSFYLSRHADQKEIKRISNESIPTRQFKNIYTEILLISISFALLIVGANLLVAGSISFAKMLGISEAIIGLTIVAAGTSLPELATSLVAAIRKNPDIAIGNVVGSNIFNIIGILGIASIISPIKAVEINTIDTLFMIIFSILLLPFMWTKFRLQRWEGFLLLTGYVLYVIILLK